MLHGPGIHCRMYVLMHFLNKFKEIEKQNMAVVEIVFCERHDGQVYKPLYSYPPVIKSCILFGL